MIWMLRRSLEHICLSLCRDTALEILALRQQGGGFLPCLTTKILRIYSSRFNWYINIITQNAEKCKPFSKILRENSSASAAFLVSTRIVEHELLIRLLLAADRDQNAVLPPADAPVVCAHILAVI